MSIRQKRQDEISAYVGLRIREMRTSRDLLQGDVARAAGIAQADLSRMESGKKRIYIDTLKAIADALGCPIALLLPPEEDEDVQRAITAARGKNVEGGLALLDLGASIIRRCRLDEST